MNYNCTICSDKGIIKNKKGKEELCKCKLLKGWNRTLASLMVDGRLIRPSKSMERFIKYLIEIENEIDKKEDKIVPKRYYLINHNENNIDGINARQYYRSLFAYYMMQTKRFIDVRVMPMYFLIDLYMGKVNQGLGEREIEDTFYNLPNKSFIIYFDVYFKNSVLLNVLQHFLDLYKDRNILFYLDKEAYYNKDTHTFLDRDSGKIVKHTKSLEVESTLKIGKLVDMVDLVRTKKGLNGIYQ